MLGGLVALAAPAELDATRGAELSAPSAPSPPSPAPASATPAVLRSISSQAPRCPKGRSHCVGIALHVVVEDGQAIQTGDFVATQLDEANRHFAAIDTGFELVSVEPLAAERKWVHSREDRDAFGAFTARPGVVHVFLVERLDDVDARPETAGVLESTPQIRGVHWRLRADIEQRWIVLSAIAPDMVLAHELGHYFGLPHSGYAISIMNKRPRENPPREKRTFHRDEVEIMRRERDQMLASRWLLERRTSGP